MSNACLPLTNTSGATRNARPGHTHPPSAAHHAQKGHSLSCPTHPSIASHPLQYLYIYLNTAVNLYTYLSSFPSLCASWVEDHLTLSPFASSGGSPAPTHSNLPTPLLTHDWPKQQAPVFIYNAVSFKSLRIKYTKSYISPKLIHDLISVIICLLLGFGIYI